MDENIIKGKLGESFVSELATKTFLSYWCYDNPQESIGKKKEICDLLVLFKQTCIIWQVKNYTFKENHERYFAKTVDKGCNQISGAERKLYDSTGPIAITYGCENKQYTFDPLAFPTCLRIVVHLGEGYRYQTLGKIISPRGGFTHIFGKQDIEVVLRELYTITDFLGYLDFREDLIKTNDPLLLGGTEKDLVGWYLVMMQRFGEVVIPKEGRLILDIEGGWDHYMSLKSKNEDVLLEIEDLIGRFVRADLVKEIDSRLLAEDLLMLNRKERRMFALVYLSFMHLCSERNLNNFSRRCMEIGGIGFVFFYYGELLEGERIPMYMQLAAEGYSYFTGYRVKKIVVVGMSSKHPVSFTTVDFSRHEIQNEQELKFLLNQLGWFQENQMTEYEINL